MRVFEVTHRGTVYRITRLIGGRDEETFYLLCSGWGNNYGEWIQTDSAAIAWSYLAEKMPRMARLEGDKPGWILAFKEAGLEVFG